MNRKTSPIAKDKGGPTPAVTQVIPEDFHGIPLDYCKKKGRYLTKNERQHISQSTPRPEDLWKGFKPAKHISDRTLELIKLLAHTMRKLAGENRNNEFQGKPAPRLKLHPVNTWDFRLEDTYFCLNCGSGYARPLRYKGEWRGPMKPCRDCGNIVFSNYWDKRTV